MQVAVLGLTKIGRMVVEKLLTGGHETVVFSRVKDELDAIVIEKAESVVQQKLIVARGIEELPNYLRKPRIVLSAMDAGEPTETVLQQIINMVEPGDVVVDCSDSNYKDTQRRSDDFEKRNIKYLGIGIAGGVHAIQNGCCLMVGGNIDAYQYITPILDSLALPNGIHTYHGVGGAGHFVQMAHNGIESGMMQAIAEGLSMLNKSDYKMNVVESANTWQAGSAVSSFLMDMAIDAFEKDPVLSQFDGIVSENEGKLTVEQAKVLNLPIPVIEQSVEFRKRTEYDKAVQDTFTAKTIQAMINELNGPVKKPDTNN